MTDFTFTANPSVFEKNHVEADKEPRQQGQKTEETQEKKGDNEDGQKKKHSFFSLTDSLLSIFLFFLYITKTSSGISDYILYYTLFLVKKSFGA